jgi:hypothetical protein
MVAGTVIYNRSKLCLDDSKVRNQRSSQKLRFYSRRKSFAFPSWIAHERGMPRKVHVKVSFGIIKEMMTVPSSLVPIKEKK